LLDFSVSSLTQSVTDMCYANSSANPSENKMFIKW